MLQQHFEWLNPGDTGEGAQIHDYGDLFREVGDALKEAQLFEDALEYYVPIQQTTEYADVSFYMTMGECCMKLNRLEEAENCYLTVTENDSRNVESRVQLAKLYEGLGMTEQAFKYVNEAVLLERQETRGRRRRRKDTRLDQLAREFKSAEMNVEETSVMPESPSDVAAPGLTTVSTTAAGRKHVHENEMDRTTNIQFLHSKMRQLQPKMNEGNLDAIEDWLDIADALLHDFRSNKVFYPVQRSVIFMGYSRAAQKRAGQYKSKAFIDEMREMACRLQESLGG